MRAGEEVTPLDEQNKPTDGAGSPRETESPAKNKLGAKNKLIWTLVFILIAALSVVAVTSLAKDFSFRSFADYIGGSHGGYIAAAFGCTLGFIVFEGVALFVLTRKLTGKTCLLDGYTYSAADIYFSAITPSATGGQPASAYFMIRDGVSGAMTTVILIANLVMYTLSIIAIGILSFALRPGIFLSFGIIPKILIIAGCVAQLSLAIAFYLLLRRPGILHALARFGLGLLVKMHIVKNPEPKLKKLERAMEDYKGASDHLRGNFRLLLGVFLFNFLQRASQITVTMFAYLAAGGTWDRALDVWAIQSYTILGTNCIPIPGAMGVSDYLLMDGFSAMLGSESAAANLELLSRALSLYSCIIICGISVLIKYIVQNKRRNKLL